MANNFVTRGEVLTLAAPEARISGNPYRDYGFNGVALIDAKTNESFTLQIRGIFEFSLAGVNPGDLIYLNEEGEMTLTAEGNVLWGRATTATDDDGNFQCFILQSE